MGFIEDNLMQGEQIVAEAKQSPLIYFWPWVLGVAGCVVSLLAWVFSPLTLVPGVVLIAFALIWTANIHGGRRYVLTNRRIIFKRGIIRRRSHDLVLRKIEGVNIDQTLAGRLFNYGTVIVTTGESSNVYKWIKAPARFAALINAQIAAETSD